MSAIRDAIRERTRRAEPAHTGGRGGLLDLLLVGLLAALMITRTPIGGLIGWGVSRVQGDHAELPSLTAYFSSGATAPLPDDLIAVAAPPEASLPDNVLPEPWRTATRTLLAQQIPPGLETRLAAAARPSLPETALAEIDALWNEHRDASTALEIAVLGSEQWARAVARAESAGEAEPYAYEGHRRYLPSGAALDCDRFVGGVLSLATALDLGWPLEIAHKVTSPYGERIHPVLKTRKFHDGVDLGVPIGTPVQAVQDGIVAVAGESNVSGKYVVIDHGHGVRTSYCHLDRVPVAQGARLTKGESFALSGNTGRSTGPHLHYGVRIAGKTMDPERFRRALR